MIKTMLNLSSTINGALAHLFVECGVQPMTTEMIAAHCLDFIKQLGAIEAKNKADAEAQAAALHAQAEVQTDAAPTVESPAPCCQAGEPCNSEQQAG